MYAGYAYPYEFVLDSRGRKTDVPVSFDLMSKRNLLSIIMTAPLTIALIAHLFEPGLLTADKTSSKAKSK